MAKIINTALATFISVEFARAIKNKFTNWDAFKLGLIDKKGNIVRKPKTKEEKDALSPLMNLIRKIKKVLLKVLPDTPVVNFVLAASLLKEEKQTPEHKDYWTEICKELTVNEMDTYQEIIKELEKMSILETTLAGDIPDIPTIKDKPTHGTFNNCPCFPVNSKMFYDVRLTGRKKYERFIKYYPDSEVAKFCRCRKNKGKTFFVQDTESGFVREIKSE
jgi:hypothetical protein